MTIQLKPVSAQVIVITGASSGIGLATARMASERGARLVLASRNAEKLREVAEECSARGSRAVPVPADVADPGDLERIASTAVESFGGFDTWVNDAAVAIYGATERVPLADQRRLFEVNYWGVVNGSLIAARHLRQRGGAIINIGSVLSDRAMIYQVPYSAAKHAVKAFTDGLRMELEADGAPISVTLIKPSAIDTPYPEHARNYMDAPALDLPPPSYEPRLVAKAILYAAEHPKRTLVVGFGGYLISLVGTHFPRLTDLAMEATGRSLQARETAGAREAPRRDNLERPREDAARSSLPSRPRRTSLFLEAQMHPAVTFALTAALGLATAYAVGGRRDARLRGSPRRRAPYWPRQRSAAARAREGRARERMGRHQSPSPLKMMTDAGCKSLG